MILRVRLANIPLQIKILSYENSMVKRLSDIESLRKIFSKFKKIAAHQKNKAKTFYYQYYGRYNYEAFKEKMNLLSKISKIDRKINKKDFKVYNFDY